MVDIVTFLEGHLEPHKIASLPTFLTLLPAIFYHASLNKMDEFERWSGDKKGLWEVSQIDEKQGAFE